MGEKDKLVIMYKKREEFLWKIAELQQVKKRGLTKCYNSYTIKV
ncbi:hypothetical protein AALB16_14710 [Lachnospiraceae bacterium 62-35]